MASTNHSVDRALQVLQLVARLGRPVRFTELVETTGIPKATLHSLLGSLETARFLEKTSTGYLIGMTAFEVGAATAPSSASTWSARASASSFGEGQLVVNWEAYPEDVASLVHAHPTQNEAFGEAFLALAGKPLHAHA